MPDTPPLIAAPPRIPRVIIAGIVASSLVVVLFSTTLFGIVSVAGATVGTDRATTTNHPTPIATQVASPTASPTAASPTARPPVTASPSPTAAEQEPADPSTSEAPPEAATVPILDSGVTQTVALALLATLPVKPAAIGVKYDRTGDFGRAWLDVDHNGCDTRSDILARDLKQIVKSGSCRVMSGVLTDTYTGKRIAFTRGQTTSLAVQIDHIVPLLDAWQTGAQKLSTEQRITLANDPLNLIAVDGPTNSSKGALDASAWLPPNVSFRCTYASRQVSVKVTYGLWVTQTEHDALARILASCPKQTAYSSPFAPAPNPAPKPLPAKPAPAKPAPAKPAPVKPAPVKPAPATGKASPGAFCADVDHLKSAVADNGRTYTCGKKGRDARGRYHWNS